MPYLSPRLPGQAGRHRWTCCPAAGSTWAWASAGCRRSSPPPARPWPAAGARAAEYIEVLRRAWADGVTEFSGEFYQVPPGRMAPKPVQRPGPPILLGGTVPGRAGTGRAARRRLGDLQPDRPVPDRRGHRGGPRRRPRRPAATRRRSGSSAAAWSGAGAPVTVPEGGGRLLLSGSYDDIRGDTHWLAEPGRHRDLLRPELGPAGRLARRRPGRRAARAAEILDRLAPGGRPSPIS